MDDVIKKAMKQKEIVNSFITKKGLQILEIKNHTKKHVMNMRKNWVKFRNE